MSQHGTLRVVIIDHYDSYTNNTLQLLSATQQTPEGSSFPKWDVVVVRFDQYTWDEFQESVLPFSDAIILSPGPGRPDRESDFGFNARLIREARIPVLGICLGHQGICSAFGARIVHAPNIKHGQTSEIQHTGLGVLNGLPQQFLGVRYNSLVLDAQSISQELSITAWCFDAENPSFKVPMGVQHISRPIFGVQWHPESVCSSLGSTILDNFYDIVHDFWGINHAANQWTKRNPAPNATLPRTILDKGAIQGAARENRRLLKPSLTGVNTNVRPYYIEVAKVETGNFLDAQYVFDLLIHKKSADGEAWLDSAKVRDVHSRNSYLSKGTFALSYSTTSKEVHFFRDGLKIKSESLSATYWQWLEEFQSTVIQANVRPLGADELGQNAETGQPILQAGLVGYFGYELKMESLPGYQSIQKTHDAVNDRPDAHFFFADTVLWLDNFTKQWKVTGLVRAGEYDPIANAIGSDKPIGLTKAEFDNYVQSVRDVFSRTRTSQLQAVPLPSFIPQDDETSYSAAINSARNSIKEGESYEMTLTTKFRAETDESDPYRLYLRLRARNPAPYSAYIEFPFDDLAILSSSPERFISIDQDNVSEMKPIKGTVAVSQDKEEDARRVQHLSTDVKELAENLMIVDLIRADLHNVAPSSSIKVLKLLHVESYETVHQLVTTIRAEIPRAISGIRVLERCFPPGSMTGAPKLRSVQVIESLEHNQPRGVYSGSLGYLCVSGTVDQSVIIRTIVKYGRDLVLGAGGAITWLSEPDKEWNEVMVKAKAVAEIITSPPSLEGSESGEEGNYVLRSDRSSSVSTIVADEDDEERERVRGKRAGYIVEETSDNGAIGPISIIESHEHLGHL